MKNTLGFLLFSFFLISCATVPPSAQYTNVAPWRSVDRSAVRIRVDRSTDQFQTQEAVIYGNGVVVWNERVQVRISPEQVEQLLSAFDRSNFGSITSSTKGKRLRRRASIRAGNYYVERYQTWEAEENATLRSLVEEIFAVVEPAATQSGIAAQSVRDGLQRIAAGQLAPETLKLMVHLKEDASAAATVSGFLFRIEDGRASSALYHGDQVGPTSTMDLTPAALREIATTLQSFDPDDLPINLYGSDYVEVRIGVLDRKKDVVARQFAGLTPARHGDRQVRFDRMLEWLIELHRKLFEGSR